MIYFKTYDITKMNNHTLHIKFTYLLTFLKKTYLHFSMESGDK